MPHGVGAFLGVYALLFALAPSVGVLFVGRAMLNRRLASGGYPADLIGRFYRYVLLGGFAVVALLILAVVLLTMITGSGQAPFWLIFAPWGFAAGEAIGLLKWTRAYPARQ